MLNQKLDCCFLRRACLKPEYPSVPDPDLEIRGGGGGWSSRPLDKAWEGGLPPKMFPPFGPQFDPKITGGRAPPLGPSLPWEKPLRTRMRTKNILNPHKASTLWQITSHQWEASAFTTAPTFLPKIFLPFRHEWALEIWLLNILSARFLSGPLSLCQHSLPSPPPSPGLEIESKNGYHYV